MKSFVDYMMEDAKSNKEDDDSKNSPEISDSEFLYGISRGPEEVYNLEDFEENSKKQMEFVYSFGPEEENEPYEITVTSKKFYHKAWDFKFTKGFNKLTSKNKSTVEQCLKGMTKAMLCFYSDLDSGDPKTYIEKMTASIPWKDTKTKEIVLDYFKKYDTKRFVRRKYKTDNSFIAGSQYNFIAKDSVV